MENVIHLYSTTAALLQYTYILPVLLCFFSSNLYTMTSIFYISALLLLFSSVSGSRLLLKDGKDEFVVQGRVFCDNCRAGFETTATKYLKGANVKVECRDRTTGKVTYLAKGVTDETGTYNIAVANDHQTDICEALLVDSPENECSEVIRGRERAQVVLTYNDGVPTIERFANNMGFQTYTPMSGCSQLMKMYETSEEYFF